MRELVAAVCTLLAPLALASDLANTSWTLVRVDNVYPDGRTVHLYGPHPQGRLLFDAGGHYAMQMYRAERTRFAANDKAAGTPEEYRAAALEGNAHFGSYEVADGVLIFRTAKATYPNWEGVERRSPATLEGDLLRYEVPAPTTGKGAKSIVEWRRERPVSG
ncbi:MAG: lipocalin-like domain-containing protein [Telluria sp.]